MNKSNTRNNRTDIKKFLQQFIASFCVMSQKNLLKFVRGRLMLVVRYKNNSALLNITEVLLLKRKTRNSILLYKQEFSNPTLSLTILS